MAVAEPTGPSPADLQAAYERLRATFIAGLAARWQVIESASDNATRQLALHRLAGAAGSYGCAELGRAAREAEARCDDARALASVAAALRALGVTVP